MSFTCVIRQVGDITVVDVDGRLVFGHGAPGVLNDVIREKITQGCRNILINLRDVVDTDTGGLGALVSALSTVTNSGGTLHFCGANERLRELLKMTRLDSVLNVTIDEAAGIDAFLTKPKGSAA